MFEDPSTKPPSGRNYIELTFDEICRKSLYSMVQTYRS